LNCMYIYLLLPLLTFLLSVKTRTHARTYTHTYTHHHHYLFTVCFHFHRVFYRFFTFSPTSTSANSIFLSPVCHPYICFGCSPSHATYALSVVALADARL
jgi:hypothetical protein